MIRTQSRTEHLAERIYKGLGKGHVNCCGSLRCGQDWEQLDCLDVTASAWAHMGLEFFWSVPAWPS